MTCTRPTLLPRTIRKDRNKIKKKKKWLLENIRELQGHPGHKTGYVRKEKFFERNAKFCISESWC